MYVLLSPYLYFVSFLHLDKLGIFYANQTCICLDPHRKKGCRWYRQTCLSLPVIVLLNVPRRYFFYGSFLLLKFRNILCSLVVSCCGLADLLALLYMMFSCDFVTFPYGDLGQVWYLIVSAFVLTMLTLDAFIRWRCTLWHAISSTVARPLGMHYNHYVSPSIRQSVNS